MADTLRSIIPLLGRTQDFREWNTAAGMDWESYYKTGGLVEQAVYWSSVFLPDFVDFRGMVLRRLPSTVVPTDYPETLSEATVGPVAELGMTQTEFLFNHLHVGDLFANDPNKGDYDIRVYRYIANLIAESWRRKVHEQFPGKEFDVGVDESSGDIQVYLVTRR